MNLTTLVSRVVNSAYVDLIKVFKKEKLVRAS